MSKFSYEPGEAVLPQCTLCRHVAAGGICSAFPAAIPPAILRNEADHRRPWADPQTGEPGDTGVAGVRSITFTPAPGVPPAALEALHRHLDGLKG